MLVKKMVQLLKFAEVSRRTTLCRSTIYGMIKRGEFPAPIKLGNRSAWIESVLDKWVSERSLQSNARKSAP